MMRERLKQWRRVRAHRRALAEVRAGRRRAVLVYSMGKVGSTTIVHALETDPALAVFHVHRIGPAPQDGEGHRRVLPVLLWQELVRPGVPAAVITLTREPLARNVSAYFQNLRRTHGGQAPWQQPVAQLQAAFLRDFPHREAIGWFDAQLGAVLGVDVYGAPFDPLAGYARLAHPRYPTLVLRCELADAAKARALQDFLRLPAAPALARANVGARKAYAQAYARFRDGLRIPESLADALLESRYARHFYAPAERAAARVRWCGSAGGPA